MGKATQLGAGLQLGRAGLRKYARILLAPVDEWRPVVRSGSDVKLKRWQAWTLVLGSYLLVFGLPAYWSIGQAFFGAEYPRIPAELSVLRSVSFLLVAIAATIVLVRRLDLPYRRVGLGGPWNRARVTLEFKTGCVAALAAVAGFGTSTVLATLAGVPSPAYPLGSMDSPMKWANQLTSSLVAGPVEELLLVVVLVWALRSAGHSWGLILATAAVLRVAFHFYYGWSAIGLAFWPMLIVLLYRATGAIIGVIIEHSWFDLTGIPAIHLSNENDPWFFLFAVLKLAPIFIGLYLAYKAAMDKRMSGVPSTA